MRSKPYTWSEGFYNWADSLFRGVAIECFENHRISNEWYRMAKESNRQCRNWGKLIWSNNPICNERRLLILNNNPWGEVLRHNP